MASGRHFTGGRDLYDDPKEVVAPNHVGPVFEEANNPFAGKLDQELGGLNGGHRSSPLSPGLNMPNKDSPRPIRVNSELGVGTQRTSCEGAYT